MRTMAVDTAAAAVPATTTHDALSASSAHALETDVQGNETHPHVPARVLTQEQIDTFLRDGVLVVPNVLSPDEVAAARAGLHSELAKYGVVRLCVHRYAWCPHDASLK